MPHLYHVITRKRKRVSPGVMNAVYNGMGYAWVTEDVLRNQCKHTHALLQHDLK